MTVFLKQINHINQLMCLLFKGRLGILYDEVVARGAAFVQLMAQ